jgi:phosphopantetheinyl transferase (holo-ACP synthase)
MPTKNKSATATQTGERRASVAWKYTGSLEDFADFKFEALHNFIDAHFAEMELLEQEEKHPEQVTAAMLNAAFEATSKALDLLIEAEFALRAALRREGEHVPRSAVLPRSLLRRKPEGNA